MYLAYNLNSVIDFVAKKNKLLGKVIFILIITILTADAAQLFNNEIKPLQQDRTVDPRNEIILEIRKYPEKELHYLVTFGERQGRLYMPPEEQIDMTWVYGGNPCAVFYSKKNVKYYYTEEEFSRALKTKKGLFLIQNGDLQYAEHRKILFKNNDYTLLRR